MRWWSMALVAAAMAAPSAAQESASTTPPPHYVFFDWGKPEISRDAAAVLEGVAAAYRAGPGARLTITGHADRSGSAASNRRSSRARAEAVADWLVARGVPRSSMTLTAHGEERPYIPTEDGVREPQNRRVEIMLTR